MNASETRALVANVLSGIAPEADLSSIGDSEDLREALDLDSMDFLNLVVGLSQGSGLSIPEADYPRLVTMNGLLRYMDR